MKPFLIIYFLGVGNTKAVAEQIKSYVQLENKKAFPYLSGVKICNYCLYVIHQYTDRKFKNLDALTAHPTHTSARQAYSLG